MAIREPLNIEKLIMKGAGVAKDNEKERRWTHFCLRIPTDMVEEIEASLSRRIGIQKTGWILEAIQEKLKRDASND